MLSAVRVLSGQPCRPPGCVLVPRRVELHDPSVSEPPDVVDRHLEPRAAGASRRGLVRDHEMRSPRSAARRPPGGNRPTAPGSPGTRRAARPRPGARSARRPRRRSWSRRRPAGESAPATPVTLSPVVVELAKPSRRLPRTLRGELRRSGTPLQDPGARSRYDARRTGGRAPAAAACRVELLGSRRQLLLLEGRAISGDELKPFSSSCRRRSTCVAIASRTSMSSVAGRSWLAGL